MPIPDAETFRKNTKPRSVFVRTGSNMIVVQAALESYWEGPRQPVELEERLLYNLWKECRRWLKKKQDKPLKKQGELFLRRKLNIESVRDAAMERLVDISPKVAKALNAYKRTGPTGAPLKDLSPGYIRERDWYLQNGKPSGYSLSENRRNYNFKQLRDDNSREGRKVLRSFGGRGYEDLTLEDVAKLDQLYPTPPVIFRNKIERLQNMVRVNEDGLLCDLNENLICMQRKRGAQYASWMYAMDQYGNLFISEDLGNRAPFMTFQKGSGFLERQGYFNHSSFLGGKQALCAGCIHIGYDTVHQKLEPGVLSSIDNNSGHYKPTREHLQNCLIALREQGVGIEHVRVGDYSQVDRNHPPRYWWGEDFAFNNFGNQWTNEETPGTGILPAPNAVQF